MKPLVLYLLIRLRVSKPSDIFSRAEWELNPKCELGVIRVSPDRA